MTLSTNPASDPSYLFSALSLSPEPVVVTDRLNHIVFWNDSAQDLLGYSAEEVAGTSCGVKLQGCDSFGNRYCSEHCPITDMAMRNEIVHHFNLVLKAKDRTSVAVDVTILRIENGPPPTFYLVHIFKPQQDREHGVELPREKRPPIALVKDALDLRLRRLTQRELEVLRMIANGLNTHDIAARLHIAPLTARNHIQNILEKIEVHSKAEAVAFAFQKKLV